MSSLAIINRTLQEQTAILVDQTKATERMAVGIDDVREQITRMIETQMSVYDMIENSRERPQLGGPGSPGDRLPGARGAGGSTGESTALTSMENLFNNIFGGLAGGLMSGALGSRLVGGVVGLMGRGLKWGLIAYAADQVLNAVFENFNVPDNLANELQGDTRRGLFAAGAGAMLGLRGKWLLIASAAGFFYDEANKLVNWITENSEAAQAAMKWFEDKTGIPAQPLAAGALSATATAASVIAGQKILQRGAGLVVSGARTAPQLLARAGRGIFNTARTTAPVVASAVKSGLRTGYSYGMRGLSAAGVVGTAPLAALAGTIGLFGASSSEYKQMLSDYPEMAPMNNGAGPGLVRGKYLLENGLLDDAIEYEKQQGTYNTRPSYQTTREAPSSLTSPGTTLAPQTTPDVGSIVDFLNSSNPTSTPIVRNNNMSEIAEYLNSVQQKPQVVVVPVPTPPQTAPVSKGGGGSAVFTAPVGTTDRLDNRDRISRPW